MSKTDRFTGLFWFFFSLFISYESYRLGLGTLYQPGPGFLFFWTGIVVAILAIAVIVRSFGHAAEEEKEAMGGRQTVTKVVLVLVALFLYALLMEWLGFIIVTLLLFVFLLWRIEKKTWWFALLVSLAVTVFTYLIFETGLQSQLPKGLLGLLRF